MQKRRQELHSRLSEARCSSKRKSQGLELCIIACVWAFSFLFFPVQEWQLGRRGESSDWIFPAIVNLEMELPKGYRERNVTIPCVQYQKILREWSTIYTEWLSFGWSMHIYYSDSYTFHMSILFWFLCILLVCRLNYWFRSIFYFHKSFIKSTNLNLHVGTVMF